MNRKQFALLLFLLIVLGLAGLMIYHRQNDLSQAGNRDLGRKLLGDFPFNDVARIQLRQDGNEVNLEKTNDLWRVRERGAYPANYSEISDFLLKGRDLKIVQSESVGPSQLPRLGLVPGQGTNAALAVDFKDKDGKTLRALLLGKKHIQKSSRPSPFGDMGEGGFPDGRYVKVGADSATVELVAEPFANIEAKPELWLNKDFFKVEKVRSISVAFVLTTNSWTVSRTNETGDWKLSAPRPGEQLDTSKTSGLATALSSPTFNDIDVKSTAAQLGLDKPTVVTVDTFDNFTYTLKVGLKTNDSYAISMAVSANLPKERVAGKDEKPEDKARLDKEFNDNAKKLQEKLSQEKTFEKWVYLVSGWTLDPVLKERGQLLVEKKEKKDEKSGISAEPATPTDSTATSDSSLVK